MTPSSLSTEQKRYLQGYSVGALTYGCVYFWAMGDWVFAGLSLISYFSLYLLPLILLFPIFARRRVWQKQGQMDFLHFRAGQQKWDQAGWWGLLFTVLFLAFLFLFVVPYLASTLSNSYPDLGNSSGSFSQQLHQVEQGVLEGN